MITLQAFSPIAVSPNQLSYELLLTANTAISHHDPALQDDSNRTLFNRQKQLLARAAAPTPPTQVEVDRVALTFPVPEDIAAIFADVSFAEFVATAIVKSFLDAYNSGDGTGLFSGMERYSRLEARLRQAAIQAPRLRNFWDRLVSAMQVPIHGGDGDAKLLGLLTVSPGLQQQVLRVLVDDYRSVVSLARLWHTTDKQRSEEYAARAGVEQAGKLVGLTFDATALAAPESGSQVVEVPTVTGNSLRHQVVREPAYWHLMAALGLAEAMPGQGPVPPGVEAIFYNGGNIEAGAKQPSNSFALAWRARARYPSLDLLGGVTDSFDLGESRLRVAAWLVCRENRHALAESDAADLPAASVSVFDLLDEVTMTRHAGRVGVGQMIMTFETLCPGAQVLCRLSLAPWTPALTRGALEAAVHAYLADDSTIGGQAARGFGCVQGDLLSQPEDYHDCAGAYEAYLAANRDELRQGLIDGTLGTGVRILT